jgi:hypothetical protein
VLLGEFGQDVLVGGIEDVVDKSIGQPVERVVT